MTVQPPPSFASRQWGVQVHTGANIEIAVAPQALALLDRERVSTFCGKAADEFSSRLGLSQESGFTCRLDLDDTLPEDGYVVTVSGATRLVGALHGPLGGRPRTGIAAGLPDAEERLVRAVEEVLLDDTGLLLDGGSQLALVQDLQPHIELPLARSVLRELVRRHLDLTDRLRVGRALTLSDQHDSEIQVGHLTALLADPDVVVEVGGLLPDTPREHLQEALDQVWDEFAVIVPGPEIRAAAEGLDPGSYRVRIGSLPRATGNLNHADEEDPAWDLVVAEVPVAVAASLTEALAELWNELTLQWWLDRIQPAYPDAVHALRRKFPDVIVGEVLRRLAEELIPRDLTLLVDLLIEARERPIHALAEFARPAFVERHLATVVPPGIPLAVVTVDPAYEAELANCSAGLGGPSVQHLPRTRAALTAVRKVVSPVLSGPSAMVIVVDQPTARAPLRRLISAQAPEVAVLHVGELPSWISTEEAGHLSVSATG